MIVLNKSEKSQRLNLEIPNLFEASAITDLTSGEKNELQNGSIEINIEGISWRMFEIK